MRETARREGLSTDRKSLHKITEQYRALYGEDYFVRKAVERIEAKSAHTVGVSGVRSPTDVRTFRQRFGRNFILVRVSVGDIRLRYRRSRERHEERDPQSFEEFVRQDRSERELFNLDCTLEEADLTISNNGTVEAFHALINEELVRKVLGFETESSSTSQVSR